MSLSGPASPRAADPNRITRSGWKYLTTASSNSGGTEPAVIVLSRRGSRRADGSGSCCLAGCQPQARQKQLLVFGLAVRRKARHDLTGNGAQPGNDGSRFVELTHMGVARSEKAVCAGMARIVLNGQEKLHSRFFKPWFEEIGPAHHS